jgi:hypothetical protein
MVAIYRRPLTTTNLTAQNDSTAPKEFSNPKFAWRVVCGQISPEINKEAPGAH